jgi:membrane peptidoglycan carboxypeptidase
MAHRLDIQMTPDIPVASIGLGSLSVSPLDMAAAYATFPAMGIYAKPMAITKVVLPGGHVDRDSNWGVPQTKRAVSQGVAWKVNDVLSQNALYGTGAGSCDGVHPCAGKTGTTENHDDAWYDGYTRQLATVVWMGYPKGEIPMVDVHGVAVQGATYCVPIWHEYMAAALWHRKVESFPPPDRYPVWKSITRGNYGYLGSYYTNTYSYTPSVVTPATTAAAPAATSTAAAPAKTSPAPKPSPKPAPAPTPTVPAPAPTTTEAPPPDTTTPAPPADTTTP